MSLLQYLYNETIRNFLPRKLGVYHRVTTRRPRLFDRSDTEQNFETEEINALQKAIDQGDTVVDLGGGFGVTTIKASQAAGWDGEVITYEAGKEHVDIIREAIELNYVEANITVHHAIVGASKHTFSDALDATLVDPGEIPDCDVMSIDIVGSELTVIPNLDDTCLPRVIVVEYYPLRGASRKQVEELLKKQGYEISDHRKVERDKSGPNQNGVLLAELLD